MNKQFDQLVHDALAIEAESAVEANSLAYLARILVLATMPHSKQEGHIFERVNGKFHLTMLAQPRYGLPYGVIPRLVLAWVSTEAVRTRTPIIDLGPSLARFMKEIGLEVTGGERGTVTYFKDHLQRLFTTSISFSFDGESDGNWQEMGFRIAYKTNLWWHPKNPLQEGLFRSQVHLSTEFYEELIRHPIPLDMRAIMALKSAPMAIDIYNWLTYRYSYLKGPTIIPWQLLHMQFGANYAHKDQFRQNFLLNLKKVLTVYPAARVEEVPRKGLQLSPSPTHVAPLLK
jgi:hypothetical protein